ncbi:MAG: sigma-54-dependent Fis family transcriptional regulator [Ignavibacteria bacterium]|nr:sigma-54-dependent Fis family transcriptional regulator [Ignavibacteria bacterium]
MEKKQFQITHSIIGNSPEIEEIIDVIQQAAPTDITVLITGESGVGKEVIARAIHAASRRAKKSLVSVNCGAIPEGIIESELFGHEKGSFTSALETRKGYFEIADGGTIFLDEVGEMPLQTQVKLLRVLENGEYMRVGSSTVRHADVRVIAATNKNLQHEVKQKRFRPDLFFRLRSVSLWIPPLRDRRSDIPLLLEHFIKEITSKNSIRFEGFTDDATELLMEHAWPGNVRELRNVIESMLVLEGGRKLNADDVRRYLHIQQAEPVERHLPVVTSKTVEQAERELIYRALLDLKSDILELKESLRQGGGEAKGTNGDRIGDEPSNGAMSLEEMERQMIRRAIERHSGNRRMAAKELKISERTLYRKIKEYSLDV